MSRHDFDGPPRKAAARTAHRHAWLWEPLETDPAFVLKPMFGGRAVCLDGRQQLVFFAKTEPWCGVLVCTDHASQESLRAEFPELSPHPVLPKWLYLPEADDGFERVGQRLVAAVSRRDGSASKASRVSGQNAAENLPRRPSWAMAFAPSCRCSSSLF